MGEKKNPLFWKMLLAVCGFLFLACLALIFLVWRREKESEQIYINAVVKESGGAGGNGETGDEGESGGSRENGDEGERGDKGGTGDEGERGVIGGTGELGLDGESGEKTEARASDRQDGQSKGSGEGEETESTEEIPIDFARLQEINPEVYAWLRVPGTKVDYPVAQRKGDRGFYLHHNIRGEYEFAGMIYTEDYNATDFQDPNTVIYGHNMKNDTMFTTLHAFEDKDFFEEHRQVIIYTPEKTLEYYIFAAYPYDDRHLMMSFDFWDKEEFGAYIKQIYQVRDMKAYTDPAIIVTNEDKILTLSTCMGGQQSKRYLVQAVLMDE